MEELKKWLDVMTESCVDMTEDSMEFTDNLSDCFPYIYYREVEINGKKYSLDVEIKLKEKDF